MFSTFKRLVVELQRLNVHVAGLVRVHEQLGPALDRLTALELSRAQFEADMEGIFLKADGKEKAARNAEARTRTMKRHAENLFDPFDPDSQEEPEAVRERHEPPGEAEGLQPVHLDMAPDHKAQALNRKWGIA